ncbi:O-antigen ligase family protein [Erwinia sp. B116]|uniref:O-antigen ligase family protein n=1 Tax=Erwinia sp. B116 TaxID=1561024 RepID=UPI000C766449|nr:O-antigen ligase family protein [Erwinia sp. B116]
MTFNKTALSSFIFTFMVSIDILQFSGLRLSLVPLFLYGCYLIIKDKSLDKSFFYIVLFALSCLPSLIFSYNPGKSLGYIVWIIFNYIGISFVFRTLILRDMSSTLFGIRNAYRFQIILGCLLYFSGIQDRAQVLYYEPSYFALSLTPYVVMLTSKYLTGLKKTTESYSSSVDVLLLLLAIYTTKSANLIFICLISAVVLLMFNKGKIKKIVFVTLACTLAWYGIGFYAESSNDLISQTYKTIVNSSDVLVSVLDRTGNRWPRAELTYDVALSHFWGVGIGAFEDYTKSVFLPDYSWLPEYLTPIGYPPVNIYFEIAATCGWISLIIWILWHFNLLSQASRLKCSKIVICSLIVAMIALSIESNFMRPYYWMLLGLLTGNISHMLRLKKEGKL